MGVIPGSEQLHPSPQDKRGGYVELLKQHLLDKEKHEPKFTLWNLKFQHDPFWRERFWSVTGIKENRWLFWRVVGWLFFATMFSLPLYLLSLKWL